MKVVQYITSVESSKGGVSTFISQLSEALGLLCDLTIISSVSEKPKVQLTHCEVRYVSQGWWHLHRWAAEFGRVLDEIQPDIVQINGIWQIQTWWIQKEAIKRSIPTVIMPHGMLEPWIMQRHRWKKKLGMMLYEKRALSQAKCLIGTSAMEAQSLLKGNYNSCIRQIECGISLENVQPRTDYHKRKNILFISRLHEKKGIELLLEAYWQLCVEGVLRDYTLTIAGTGRACYVNKLNRKIRKMSCRDQIRMLGAVNGEKKWLLYKTADVMILPSRSENFGYVIAEALACGTPVITTEETPWGDVQTYSCGMWIRRDLDTLKSAMIRMCKMSDVEMGNMGSNARHLIEMKHDIHSTANSLLDLYAAFRNMDIKKS